MVKPTRIGEAPIEELIPLLPEGIGMVPVYLGVRHGSYDEFASAMPAYERLVELLSDQHCDIIAVEGAPPFMVQGFKRETELVSEWEKKYRTTLFTTAMNQTRALRALGVKKFVGATYLAPQLNAIFQKYFIERGFDVPEIAAFETPFEKAPEIPGEQIAEFLKSVHKRHPDVDALYLLGSGWRTTGIIDPLEHELGIPLVQPVAARAWEIQWRLRLHHPVKGYGRLMSELPPPPPES
jgi:maleate isomerase